MRDRASPSPSAVSVAREASGLAAIGDAWDRFWFHAADSRPLSLVRVGAAAIAIALWWSYAIDLQSWFGPQGVLPVDAVREARPPFGFSLFDWAGTGVSLTLLFAATGMVFAMLLVGAATPVVAPLAAVLWASLLHRGPMLAGPADDCLSILLWCLAIGPAGAHWSIDSWLANRAARPAPGASWRAGLTAGLLQVHATAITGAALLAQLKGDAWWDGLAAWYLAAGPRGDAAVLLPFFERSEYLTNLFTHAVTAFEILYAVGLWWGPSQRLVATVGLIGWPLVGLLAGEPFWGLAMALFALPAAARHDVS